jgi:hypothetical protein
LTAAHCTESFFEVQVGRHNRSDDFEEYQSLIVESIVNHPSYFRNKFLDPDPHDFAVVKLYGHASSAIITSTSSSSRGSYIQFNRNSELPTPNQQMHVFGWGAFNLNDFREQSDVLRETDAYYIPNDDCRQVVGTYRNITIDYEQVVVDATLCAMNFENLTDSCRGDSGGGLVLRGETPQDDILVGIVSAGYGCANPTLPALYARVSEVHEWIREQVCVLSEYPPRYLECDDDVWKRNHIDTQEQEEPDLGLAFPCEDLPMGRDSDASVTTTVPSSQNVGVPCSPDDPISTVLLDLRLDDNPKERGWILRRKNLKGIWVTEMERPIFFYSDWQPSSIVRETLFLRNNYEYEFVLLDSYGDGHYSTGVTVSSTILRLFDQDNYNDLLTITEFSRMNSNGYHLSSTFVLGALPTKSPTISPSPTFTLYPSSSPSNMRPFITVNITFGAFPENIGFRLEKLLEQNEVENDPDAADNDYVLLHVVYPGTFSPDLKFSERKVEIPLEGVNENASQSYIFTMTSNEGQGLDMGGFQVWLGAVDDGTLLFEGGVFYYETSTSFLVDPPPVSSPQLSESLNDRPTPSPVSSELVDVDSFESGSSHPYAGPVCATMTFGCLALALLMIQVA